MTPRNSVLHFTRDELHVVYNNFCISQCKTSNQVVDTGWGRAPFMAQIKSSGKEVNAS